MRPRRHHARRARSSPSDAPAALLAGLGRESLELRVDGDGDAALAALRASGLAGDDAFAVGATVTRARSTTATAADAVAAVDRLGLAARRLGTRRPTLDDVYLLLTGDRSPPDRPTRRTPRDHRSPPRPLPTVTVPAVPAVPVPVAALAACSPAAGSRSAPAPRASC